MKQKTFEYENVVVNVFFEHIPTKDELKESCSLFMRNIEQKEKADAGTST